MTWKCWLHGLLAAIVASFGTLGATGVAGYARDYDLLSWDFWEPCVVATLVNGWISARLYIAQFPPPGTPKTQSDGKK